MNKIFLGLKWINHVQVTRTGGKKVTRDESYEELVESQDLLSRILTRVRRVHGTNSPLVDVWHKKFHADVKRANKSGQVVRNTVMAQNDRKMLTYEIKPLKIQWGSNGATYLVTDKGIQHVAGARPWFKSDDSVNVHLGLTDEQAKAAGIVRGNVDTEYTLERIENRAQEIRDERCAKANPDVLAKDPKNGSELAKVIIEGKAKDAAKAAKDKAQSDDEPPFSPLPDKETKKVEKKVDEKKQSKVQSGKKLSKKQENECKKFGLDVNNLPDVKPSGMNNKIWKAINK